MPLNSYVFEGGVVPPTYVLVVPNVAAAAYKEASIKTGKAKLASRRFMSQVGNSYKTIGISLQFETRIHYN